MKINRHHTLPWMLIAVLCCMINILSADPARSVPTVINPYYMPIDASSGQLVAQVADDGGLPITEQGVVFAPTATHPNPQLGDTGATHFVAGESPPGFFFVQVSGLTPGTQYSYAAYATNSMGTGYSTVGTFVSTPFTYTVANGTVTITGYQGSDFNVSIPASIVGIPVTAISNNAFQMYGFAPITSVSIPASVTSIGNGAFQNVQNLMSITVDPQNPNYSSVDGLLYDKNQTTLIQCPGGKSGSVTIPAGVTNIADSAFQGCAWLTSVNIPSSVTRIGSYAFDQCFRLANLTIPPGLTTIADSAFSDIGLTSITIPSSVTSIGNNAFKYCDNLTSVNFLGDAPAIGSGVFDSTASAFKLYYLPGSAGFTSPTWHGYASATLPTVKDARYYPSSASNGSFDCQVASDGGSALTERGVVFAPTVSNPNPQIGGAGVTKLADSGTGTTTDEFFVNVYGLTPGTQYSFAAYATNGGGTGYSTVGGFVATDFIYTVANGTVTITGYNGFDGNVTIPVSIGGLPVTTISNNAFQMVRFAQITGVSIPASVTSIGNAAFQDVQSLMSITVDPRNPNYSSVDGLLYDKNQTTLIQCPGGKSGSVTIPAGVTSIGSHAFFYCQDLTGVTIPAGVTSIGNEAFYCCTGLTSVVIPAGVTSMGNEAFTNSGVRSVHFLGAAPTLGSGAFDRLLYSFKLYYLPGSAGFTSPTWNGYPTATAPTGMGISVYSDSNTSAYVNGSVASDGGSTLTARGVVFALTGTNPNPQLGGAGVTTVVGAGTSTGPFSVQVSGLTPGGQYSFAAYATNGGGSTYSSVVTITASPYSIDTHGTDVTLTDALTISGASLTKLGSGSLTLSNTGNTFSGNVNVLDGSLVASAGHNDTNSPGALGLANTAGRTITLSTGTLLQFSANDVLGNAGSSPAVAIIANGATITNTGNFFNTLGPVTLNAGTLNAVGGVNPAYQAWSLKGTITVGGSAPSTIISSGDHSGIHLNDNTVFNVADVTGDANPDLLLSAPLLDQPGGAAGGFEKTGAGTMNLSGDHSYAGATIVSAGTLEYDGSLGATGEAVSVAGGTLVVGAGSQIARDVNVSSGAIHLTGSLTATLTVTGGTVTTSAGLPTVTSADFSVGTGAVAPGSALAITSTLKMGATTATLTGGSSFTAQGANLANSATASTLTLSGGTLALSHFTTPPAVALTNPSFETDDGIDNTYHYQTITGWTGGNGIEQGTSAVFAPVPGDTGLPDYNAGTNQKWAFIQGGQTLSQPITITTAGYYTVSFAEAGRSGSNAGDPYGPLDVQALFDATPATVVLVPSTSAWTSITSDPVYLTAGSHTLNFVFTNPLGGDKSSVLDTVSVNGSASSTANLPATAVAATASSVLDLSSAIGAHTLASLDLTAGDAATTLSLKNGASLTLNGDGDHNAISATGSTGQSAAIVPDATSPPSLIIGSGANVSVDTGVTLTVQSDISGGQVTKTGGGRLVLAGTNTYTGNTTVTAGTLEIASGASVKLVPAANGISNRITGTGYLLLKGTFNVDLSGAAAVAGNSWTLVDTGALTVTVDPSFAVVGFTKTADVWIKADGNNKWIFSSGTGKLTYASGYAEWITKLDGYTGDTSPDHVGVDGISNLMNYVLFNGDPRVPNSATLPALADDGAGNMVFTIYRNHGTTADTTQSFEYTSDMRNWSALSIPESGSAAGVRVSADTPSAGVDEVKVTIAKGNSTQLFGRLKVLQP